MDIIIHLSKLQDCTTTRVNHYINCGLCVIMMNQCKIISFNKHTATVKDVNDGGGYACVGAEGIWKISVPSLQCCYESKTTLKKSLNLEIYIYNCISVLLILISKL